MADSASTKATSPAPAAKQAPAAAAGDDGAKSAAGEIEETVQHAWLVLRAFSARPFTQLLHFAEGDVIDHHLGAALAAGGAPVRPIEE